MCNIYSINACILGCELCAKTCGTCHKNVHVPTFCPLKCTNLKSTEFCESVVEKGNCNDDEVLKSCVKSCTNCTKSIFLDIQ